MAALERLADTPASGSATAWIDSKLRWIECPLSPGADVQIKQMPPKSGAATGQKQPYSAGAISRPRPIRKYLGQSFLARFPAAASKGPAANPIGRRTSPTSTSLRNLDSLLPADKECC